MTMLLMESFGAASIADLLTYGKWWTISPALPGSWALGAGRSSGQQALYWSSGSTQFGFGNVRLTYNLNRAVPVLTAQFAFMDRGTTPGGQNTSWCYFSDVNSNDQFDIRMDALRQPTMTRNGTLLATATGLQYFLNRWHHVGITVSISPTVGWAELMLDGVLILSYYGTGTSRATANGNTAGQGTTGAWFFNLGAPSQSASAAFFPTWCDVLVMDNQGTVNNAFLGDRRVVWLPPNGSGTHTDFAVGGTAPTQGAAAPTAGPTFTKADTGGTVAIGAYLAAVAWRNANGSTQTGPTSTVTTVTGTSTLTVNPGALPTNVTGWDLYLSQPGGSTLTRQNAAPLVGAFTLTTPPTNTGQAPPTTNTTTANWRAVSANPVAGDASYVQANAAGAMDTYNITDLVPGVISVDALRVQTIMRKTDAGFRFGAPVVRVAGADVTIGSTPLQQSYGQLAAILETRPDNNPWTVADVNALEVGATIVS